MASTKKIAAFVPTVVPTVLVEDVLVTTLRNRKITTAADAESSEIVAEIEESGVMSFKPGAITLAVNQKPSERLFKKTYLQYTSDQLVALGLLLPDQVKSFDAWQKTESARIEAQKAAKAAQRAANPQPILSAEQQAEKDRKTEERKMEKRAAAKTAAIMLRKNSSQPAPVAQ